MASSVWLNEHGALVDYTDIAVAPSKDFYHVFVTPKHMIFRIWKIVPPTRADSHIPPYEFKNTYQEFEHDDRCHSEIVRVAGENTLNYLLQVAKGHLDYMCRLPRPVLIKMIVDNLGLEDIGRLGRVNKQFRELCNSCDLWERIYRKYSETPITPELEMLAAEKGWQRLFFTNKLQLQMQLRRMKKHEGMDTTPAPGGHAFITQTTEGILMKLGRDEVLKIPYKFIAPLQNVSCALILCPKKIVVKNECK